MRVNTIYPAFMGEINKYGIGAPCTFVRLAGCNLRCYHKTKGTLCDTPEALSMNCGHEMSVSEILSEVYRFGHKVICLTGGEPLMQNVTELLTQLTNNGFYVVIETNGSRSVAPYRHIRNVSFIVDVKSTGSGESERMLEDNYSLLNEDDFLKFVIDTEDDFIDFNNWITSHPDVKCHVAVGAFWGSSLDYQWIIKRITTEYKNVYLNMQTHKMACLYDCYKNNESFKDLFIPKEL